MPSVLMLPANVRPAVGIERRALEPSSRNVVQNRIGNTKKLSVEKVRRLCLELSRYRSLILMF